MPRQRPASQSVTNTSSERSIPFYSDTSSIPSVTSRWVRDEVARIVMDTRRTAVAIDEVRVVAGAAGIPIWNFHFRADGSLTVDVPQTIGLSVDEAVARGETQARALKRQLFRRGLLSPSDAMYVAMRVLEDHDHVAAALTQRFDEVIVDEAQDTYSVQFASLDALKANNLTSIVLAGDVDQAIYGWMGPRPRRAKNSPHGNVSPSCH